MGTARHLPAAPFAGQGVVWDGTKWAATSGGANLLAAGEEVFPRGQAQGSTTMTSQMLRLSYFTAAKTETITQIAYATAATAAAATPSLIRYGIYSVAANGDLTLINSTVSDTALFVSAFGEYAKALSSSFSKVAGSRYASAVLVVTAVAAPTLYAVSISSQQAARAPRLTGQVASQTDLPSSVASASVAAVGAGPQAILIP